MGSVKSQTLNSAKWMAIDKFSNQGVNFLLGIILARLLSPEDFGVLGIITVVLAITSTFIDSGFSSALIQKTNVTEKDCSTVFFFNVVIAITAYILIFFSAPLVSRFFKMDVLVSVLRVQSLNLIVNSFAAVQVTKLTIELDFKAMAIRSFLASILSGVAAVFMAYVGMGVWALVGQTLLFSFFHLLFISIYIRWYPREGFSKKSFIELGGYGSKLLISSLLHTFSEQLTSLLIGRYYSAKDLGYFKRGSEFANMPVMAINGVLNKITFPIMAKIQDDRERLVVVYRKYIKSTSMVIFIFCLSLASLAKPVILFLLGEKWIESVVYLQIFGISCMFNHISSINLNLLKVVGRSDLYLRLEIIKKTLSLSILLISVSFGVLAICVGMFFYNQIAIVINTYYTGKLFGLSYWVQVKDFALYLICAFLACFPAYMLSLSPLKPLLVIMTGVIMSFFIYWYLLRKDILMKEFMSLVTMQLQAVKRYIEKK